MKSINESLGYLNEIMDRSLRSHKNRIKDMLGCLAYEQLYIEIPEVRYALILEFIGSLQKNTTTVKSKIKVW